jgi:predicted secreted Zn-dependent protease
MLHSEIYTRRFTVSGCVDTGKGIIHSVVFAANDSGNTVITLYDGVDTTGNKIAVFRALANTTNQVIFPYGYIFYKGLYLEVDANCENVIISIEKLNN